MRRRGLLVAVSLLFVAGLALPEAGALGTTTMPPNFYTIEGTYTACQKREPAGGAVATVQVTGFEGWIKRGSGISYHNSFDELILTMEAFPDIRCNYGPNEVRIVGYGQGLGLDR